MKPYYETELGKLYNGDCLEIMQHLIENREKVILIITDPPYGINAEKGVGMNLNAKAKKYKDDWDYETPKQEIFDLMYKLSENLIIFGGNFFTDKLRQSNKWIVWDKFGTMPNNTPLSDCELIYTNLKGNAIKKKTVIQAGFIASERERFHPTQKPVKLYKNLIEENCDNGVILDCFSGSGTLAVACEQLGRRWICIEQEKKYCDITVQRLSEIQQTLF